MAKMPEKKSGIKIVVQEGPEGEKNNLCIKSTNPLVTDIILPELKKFGKSINLSDLASELPVADDDGFNSILDMIVSSLMKSISSENEIHLHLLVDTMEWDVDEVVTYLKELWDEEMQKIENTERHLNDLDINLD